MRPLLQRPNEGWQIGMMRDLESSVRIVTGDVVLVAGQEFGECLPTGKEAIESE
jgi:hypothetical protein